MDHYWSNELSMDPKRLLTHSLTTHPKGEKITNILASSLNAVDPYKAVRRFMKRHNFRLEIGECNYDLETIEHVYVIGFGKASYPMTVSAIDILEDYFTQGIAIVKSKEDRPSHVHPSLSIFEASHPVPDERSIAGAHSIIELLSRTTKHDLVIFLISGGGSSLLTAPVNNINLDDLQRLSRLLLNGGATINEINCLRKHLSRVKGGQLARITAPSRLATFILSDVVGDPLDVIASGPTVPDPTTFSNAISVLKKYRILQKAPESIVLHLKQGERGVVPETPKAGDPLFNHVQNLIVGNNLLAAQAALQEARRNSFNALLLTTSLQGEAKLVGRILASIARQIHATGDPVARPACIIAGGETTVKITNDGLGGRNQEVALAAVSDYAGLPESMLITMATDGDDGPTDAAGAVVSGDTYFRAQDLGLDPVDFLTRNDSYNFFNPLGDLLKPGITETNVCDLNFIFAF
jgi:hydroxypyruvate reductase